MTENAKPMKWHNFMIYFGLWVGAIRALAEASTFINGELYGNMRLRDRVYEVFPSMHWIDVAYGLALTAMAIYQIYTRFELAKFRKNAPSKLRFLYIASFITSLSYILLGTMATGVSFIQPDNASKLLVDLITTIIMFFINKVYYDKRAELFVN